MRLRLIPGCAANAPRIRAASGSRWSPWFISCASINSLILLVVTAGLSDGQDTFSIVAVDQVTGEVGSAGASCVAGSIILSDVLPGRGVIHTQAFYLSQNQINARNRLLGGDSPQEVIDWLIANDAQGNPTIRQYGIADFGPANQPRVAAYTGINTNDYKGQILGVDYSVQGNILLGPEILQGMETGFHDEPGLLPRKLMAALQGANVIGADIRCASRGTSSISAFIRVGMPHDTASSLYLDLNVNSTPFGVEPIDELQGLFDAWLIDHDGDFDDNELFDCRDVDSLVSAIALGNDPPEFDLNRDGFVDHVDLQRWLTEAGAMNLPSGNPYPLGDATLDGSVDGADFGSWNSNKFTELASWCGGDFTADGVIDGGDFSVWNTHKFTSAANVPNLPEPCSLWQFALGSMMVLGGTSRRANQPS